MNAASYVRRMKKVMTHDVIISGGGMVGLSLALALAQGGLHVCIIERTGFDTQHDEKFDGRVSAIAHGSKRMLEALGVWAPMQQNACPILDIRVSDDDSASFLHYNYKEVGDDPFGYIAENRHLRQSLYRAAQALPNLDFHVPHHITQIDVGQVSARIVCDDGAVLAAPLLVGAEGKHSPVRSAAKIDVVGGGYSQTAIVCSIAHSLPHNGLAQERFLPVGPFAVLPMTENRSSLVWVESPDMAAHLVTLPEEVLVKEIKTRVGDYLGEVSLLGPRYTYPLGVQHATRYIDKRLALVGDAAHAIHPLAGQGLNLGLRDVAVLAELVLDNARLGMDVGATQMLSRYQSWRRFDNVSMTLATDGLNRLFSNDFLPLKLARRTGLSAVGKLPGVKRLFMRTAMGAEGKLPRLLMGQAA